MKIEGKKFAICIDGWGPYSRSSGHYFIRIPIFFDGRSVIDDHPREWEARGDIVVLAFQARHNAVEGIVEECLSIVKSMSQTGELDVWHPLFGDTESRGWIGLDETRMDAFCAEAWLEWEDEDTEGWPNSINAVGKE